MFNAESLLTPPGAALRPETYRTHGSGDSGPLDAILPLSASMPSLAGGRMEWDHGGHPSLAVKSRIRGQLRRMSDEVGHYAEDIPYRQGK